MAGEISCHISFGLSSDKCAFIERNIVVGSLLPKKREHDKGQFVNFSKLFLLEIRSIILESYYFGGIL